MAGSRRMLRQTLARRGGPRCPPSACGASTRPTGSDEAVTTLTDPARQQLITVHDAATVSRSPGARKPKTRQLRDLASAGVLGGLSGWMLFGLLLLVPLLGAAIGAAAGALVGQLTDIGIDDTFIKRVREEITPGTSPMFVLTSDAVPDRVKEAFVDQRTDLLHTDLSREEEALLREAFAG